MKIVNEGRNTPLSQEHCGLLTIQKSIGLSSPIPRYMDNCFVCSLNIYNLNAKGTNLHRQKPLRNFTSTYNPIYKSTTFA